MDFEQLPEDQDDMDNVLVAVDRLGKRSSTILYKKGVTAKLIALIYYTTGESMASRRQRYPTEARNSC